MQLDQSDGRDVELAFPHSYELEGLQDLPGLGAPKTPVIYIPPPGLRAEHNGVWLTIRPSNGRVWTGVFAQGFPGHFFSRIMSSPDPDRFIVISSGAGYFARADDPDNWEHLPIEPITQALALKQHNLIVFATHDRLAAYGSSGLQWRTPPLVPDSIKVGRIEGNTRGNGLRPRQYLGHRLVHA